VPEPWRAQVISRIGNRALLRRWIENSRETDVMRIELNALSRGQSWNGFLAIQSTAGMSERVVEIPWVLSRCRGEQRLLDLGPAFAVTFYTRYLARLGITELHGIDLRSTRIKGMTVTVGDARHMAYPDAHFDVITCVSTLEHIGRDNSDYGIHKPTQPDGDVAALREMRRVLKTTGRILLTVPFGRIQYLNWMKQYDLAAWALLLKETGLRAMETTLFCYQSVPGWQAVGPPTGAEINSYQEEGAIAATGVLCACLVPAGASERFQPVPVGDRL
jgi:O-antigen chain-terminating methyltransferase